MYQRHNSLSNINSSINKIVIFVIPVFFLISLMPNVFAVYCVESCRYDFDIMRYSLEYKDQILIITPEIAFTGYNLHGTARGLMIMVDPNNNVDEQYSQKVRIHPDENHVLKFHYNIVEEGKHKGSFSVIPPSHEHRFQWVRFDLNLNFEKPLVVKNDMESLICKNEDAVTNKYFVCNMNVIVSDEISPELLVPDTIISEAKNDKGSIVNYAEKIMLRDDRDPNPLLTCDIPSNSLFELGSTTVTCTTTDAAGNTSIPKTFDIVVQDTTPPKQMKNPENIVITATPVGIAFVEFLIPEFIDEVGVDNNLTRCKPSSGSSFSIGETKVVCTAIDNAENKGYTEFIITVEQFWTDELIIIAVILGIFFVIFGSILVLKKKSTNPKLEQIFVLCLFMLILLVGISLIILGDVEK